MSFETASFVVHRGDRAFSCLGSELSTQLKAGDRLIVQKPGDAKASQYNWVSLDDFSSTVDGNDWLVCTDTDAVTYKVNASKLVPPLNYLDWIKWLNGNAGLGEITRATFSKFLGDWLYTKIISKIESNSGLYRCKWRELDLSKGFNANFKKVCPLNPLIEITPAFKEQGDLYILSEQVFVAWSDYDYLYTNDAGKNWSQQFEIDSSSKKIKHEVAQISADTWRFYTKDPYYVDLKIKSLTEHEITRGTRPDYWNYYNMDAVRIDPLSAGKQVYPDSNGYFFGSTYSGAVGSTMMRWTDPKWEASTVPETMSCPSPEDTPGGCKKVAFVDRPLWDGITKTYAVRFQFWDEDNKKLDPGHGSIYHFAWGDGVAKIHPASNHMPWVKDPRSFCFRKLVVEEKTVGWMYHAGVSGEKQYRYDTPNYAWNGGKLDDLDKPLIMYMPCPVNLYAGTSRCQAAILEQANGDCK